MTAHLQRLAVTGVSMAVLMLACDIAAHAQSTPSTARPRAVHTIDPNSPDLVSAPSSNYGQPQIDTPASTTAGSIIPGGANYGRPKKRPDPRLKYPGRPVADGKKPLPPLVPYASAPRPRQQTALPADLPPPGPTYAAVPQLPRKARPRVEENPYAPLGINFGGLRLLPYLDIEGGYDSNALRTHATPKSSGIARTEAGASVQSNWSNHELKGEIRGGYTKYTSVPDANRPEGSGKITLRLDATRDTKVNFELRGTLTTQRPGSPELTAAVIGRPTILSTGATAGVTQNFNRFQVGVAALVDRTAYADGKLTNGGTVPLAGGSFTQLGVRGTIGYEITPGMRPFADVTLDTRRRDSATDTAGYKRDSKGLTARVGSTVELTRVVTGEVAAGYATRKYDDTRLADLRGPTFDAALIWTASPLTTVTLRGNTTLGETTVTGASGSISRRLSVDLTHQLMRNLAIGGGLAYTTNDYQGAVLNEKYLTGTLKAEYSLTRSIVLRGSFTQERLKSTNAGSDYTANIFLVGLRLQR